MSKKKLIPKELSGAAKMITMIQKAIAKEFLAIFVILLIAFPVAILIAYIMAVYATHDTDLVFMNLLGDNADTGGKYSFVVLYIITIVGLYFVRMMIGAIQVLMKTEEEE